jgi:hypothetical protein
VVALMSKIDVAVGLCRGGIQTPCRTVFPYEAIRLVMERPREACLPRSDLTRPAALQPQRSRIYRREQTVCFRLLGLSDDDLDVARIATAVVESQHSNTLLGF